eukprot:gnl/Dysnectes_brevis/1761_a2008_2392.p1 GENE.gnl/Dysnectes_brevis/1761_a2008_2392~~gnl/Dysnectes_brevis/1761_a2008_2392.p1  ORF type:complete len:571 (+),score=226.17 gnl/Dysnectes_brevis/1761_a2008_2392:62-1774(+)
MPSTEVDTLSLDNLTVRGQNGKVVVIRGTSIYDVLLSHPELFNPHKNGLEAIACLMNNEITALSQRIDVNCTIIPIFPDSADGAGIYRRSLSFVFSIASLRAFPDRRLVISHSLGHCFYYFYDSADRDFASTTPLSKEDLETLEHHMSELVEADMPIVSRYPIAYADAIQYFKDHNMEQSVALLENKNDPRVFVTRCGEYMNLYNSAIVPRTSMLRVWGLQPYDGGFLLRYPGQVDPTVLPPVSVCRPMFEVYRQHEKWGSILQVPSVGHLNTMINAGRSKEFLHICESLHNKTMAEMCTNVTPEHKLILIAGPSSSGKTSVAKKLSINLRVLGRKPQVISLDNYFVNREDTPLGDDGKWDFEAVEAVDLPLFNDHLRRLVDGERVDTPIFDFKTGRRKPGPPMQLADGGILICEGIHGLNPRISSQVKRENKYLVFISPLTQLNIDSTTRISTTDNRLIRRIVRDVQFRGHSPAATIMMWPMVRRGEKKHIFPHQIRADFSFNSSLEYELSILSTYVRPLLHAISPTSPAYPTARRLLQFLERFLALDAHDVGPHSILREFIGGSGFSY